MLSSFPTAMIAGILFGFLAGLGIGGGSLLMVWLTVVLELPTMDARCINLLFFIPCALCACIFRWKQGGLNLKKIVIPALAGCVCAAVFSWIGSHMNTETMKKIFGILLIVTGLRELFYRGKEFK